MKKLCAVLLVITILLCSAAVAEDDTQELYCLWDIPMGIPVSEFASQLKEQTGIPISSKGSYYSRSSDQVYTLCGTEIESIYANFDSSGTIIGDYSSLYISLVPPKSLSLSEGIDYYLSIVMTLEDTFNSKATIRLCTVSDEGKDEWIIQKLDDDSFDRTALTYFFSHAYSSQTVSAILNNISISMGYYSVSNGRLNFGFLSVYQQNIPTPYEPNATIRVYSADDRAANTEIHNSTTLSIGEWECPDHIAAGEYVVTPVKSATIAVYRNGGLKVNEYLRTDEDDEIGRLVLEEGDTIEIGSGKLQFTPFK